VTDMALALAPGMLQAPLDFLNGSRRLAKDD
jgi:hypothetical protein